MGGSCISKDEGFVVEAADTTSEVNPADTAEAKSQDEKSTPRHVAPQIIGSLVGAPLAKLAGDEPTPQMFERCLGDTTPHVSYAAPLGEEKSTTHHFTDENPMVQTVGLQSLVDLFMGAGIHVSPSDLKLKQCLCSTNKSNVYKAEWQGTMVVAKLVKHLEDVDNAEENVPKKELLHEIKILSKLQHPSLVQFMGARVDMEHGSHILLTEYCEAGDMESYMQQQRLRAQRIYKPQNKLALSWALSIAEALNFLHSATSPIIHRDLKPLNLLLTKALDLKVSDLGISKILPPQGQGCSQEPAPKMSGGVGTWRYMPPEVVRYEQYTDRADIYSFSLILFFIFSGRQPFYHIVDRDTELILKAYLNGQEPRPLLNDDVGTAELRELMQDAWHVVDSNRPSAEACARQLAEMLRAARARRPSFGNSSQSLKTTWKRCTSY